MKQQPLISIIVPVYNAELTIKKCVKSIIAQTYQNLEIILVNDGSKDNSLKICNNLKQDDNRIIVIDKENEKVSKTRNRGIEEANGEYIVFVDADDFIKKDMIIELERQMQLYDLCTCNYYLEKDEKRILKSDLCSFEENNLNLYIEKLQEDMLFNPIWNKMYKTKIIKDNNVRFKNNIQVGEDYLFNIDYLNFAKKVKYIKEPLYYYKVQNESLSKKYTKREIINEMEIVRTLKQFYEKNSFSMEYVYNQYIELFKSNIMNLILGEKSKLEITEYMLEFIEEFKKDLMFKSEIKKMLKNENKFIWIAIQHHYIQLLYCYFIIRNQIKNIIKK